MIDTLKKVLSETRVDFADIRHETRRDTNVVFRGRELAEAGTHTTDGFVVRVLSHGGFGFCSVTRLDHLREALAQATDAAETLAKSGRKRINLAPRPVVETMVKPKLEVDPLDVPLGEKIVTLERYNTLVLGEPEVASTMMSYFEVNREKSYVSTDGAAIVERLATTGISGSIIAKRGVLTQDVRVAVGGSDGFARILNRDDVFRMKAGIAKELLDAQPVRGGTYNVILNPLLAGVFTHEAFGHFSEADIIETNPSMRSKMELGTALGSGVVSIHADSTISGQLGFYVYDDEGSPVRPVTLMDRGVLSGRLHSRRTAAAFDEPVTGHCVAEDFRYAPIVRMGTIFIEAGDRTFGDLLKELGDGLYLLDGKGGQTSGESFTFGAQYGYVVEGGKVGSMVRDINIMGNLFRTLKNIVAADDAMELSERGGCGKGQTNIKSSLGGPHVLVENMVVGGV
jgi:TldD protein